MLQIYVNFANLVLTNFKSGWISIVGNPNVGKSTLLNALLGEKVSIVTHKPQTTRKRFNAILNGENYQMVFSDTPGVLKPHYKMQETMLRRVGEALHDADILLAVTDVKENGFDEWLLQRLKSSDIPIIAVLNKLDISSQEDAAKKLEFIKATLNPKELIAISAFTGFHVRELHDILLKYLSEGEPYFPVDQVSDMPEKFFAAELLREQILKKYREEIPYSVEVVVEEFKEKNAILFIRTVIYVDKYSQKGIIIGKKGLALKDVASAARINMEKWYNTKVFLEVQVKVKKNWREDEQQLKNFGYL